MELALSINDTITAMESAFRDLASGQAIMPPRTSNSMPDNGWIGLMPAYLKGINAFSTKIVSIYPNNPSINLPTTSAIIILNDPATGQVLAIMDGTLITSYRTGALGALAAKYLSRKDSRVVGIIGAGAQARTQLMGLKEVRDITRVLIYDIVTERSSKFADEVGKELRLPIEVCRNSSEAVANSDIIVTASTSKTPILDGSKVKPGTHLNAFGNFKPNEREIDTLTVKKAKIIVDLKEAALSEAGDILIPIGEGEITEKDILAELGEIITGSKIGRTTNEDVTLFKSVGLGIQDCAAASIAYRKAMEKGLGTLVSLH